jgi:hypothetical protein
MKQTGGYHDSGCGLDDGPKEQSNLRISDDYRKGVTDAIVWILRNQKDYKPEFIAEQLAIDLL